MKNLTQIVSCVPLVILFKQNLTQTPEMAKIGSISELLEKKPAQ